MIDLDKISKLTGFVDKLIQLKGIEDTLDEEKIAGLIQDAINFTQATYSKEEIDAARRDLTWRYEIQTSPGASILSDTKKITSGMMMSNPELNRSSGQDTKTT